MGHLYFLLGLGALVLLAFLISLYKTAARRYRLPYVADPVLFTPAQLAFLAVLRRAVGKNYLVYGRVRAADVIAPRRRLDRRTRRCAWERLAERRFDFLVCRADTSAIVCAVNLAPRSRLRRGIPRDALDRICAAAGLPLVRFRESDVYSAAEIAKRVRVALKAVPAVESAPSEQALADDLDGLDDLGEILVADDRRAAHARSRLSLRRPAETGTHKPAPARPAPAKPVALKSASGRPVPQAAPLEAPRLEPQSIGAGDIDLGPSFRIDGDLDEEDRPARRGRA